MFLYQKGTGGGSGDGADFCLWDKRDGTATSSYLGGQLSKLYMTPIYMWEKSANYPLVKSKEPIPSHAAIQDGTAKTPPKAESSAKHITTALKALSAERAISSERIFSAMSGRNENEKSVTEQIDESVQAIANTNQQVLQCEEKIVGLLGKEGEINHGHGKLDQKKKKAKRIKDYIK